MYFKNWQATEWGNTTWFWEEDRRTEEQKKLCCICATAVMEC